MRINGIIATALGVTIIGTAALADDYPPRKAGLWEVTISAGENVSHTMKMCIDPDTDQLFHKFGTDLRTKHCARNDVKVDGSVVTADSECKVGSTTITTTSVTNFTGDSAYHVDVKTHFDPPLLGKSDASVTQDGKWTGPCPAGMKPGDFILANGMKINVKMLSVLSKFVPGQ